MSTSSKPHLLNPCTLSSDWPQLMQQKQSPKPQQHLPRTDRAKRLHPTRKFTEVRSVGISQRRSPGTGARVAISKVPKKDKAAGGFHHTATSCSPPLGWNTAVLAGRSLPWLSGYPQPGGTESRKPYAQGMLGTHPRTIALKATWLRIKETAAKESRRGNQHSGQ